MSIIIHILIVDLIHFLLSGLQIILLVFVSGTILLLLNNALVLWILHRMIAVLIKEHVGPRIAHVRLVVLQLRLRKRGNERARPLHLIAVPGLLAASTIALQLVILYRVGKHVA